MIFKYCLSISGDNFYPSKIINGINGDFIVESYFSATDKKFSDRPDEFGYGGMSFLHPRKFSTDDDIIEYENAFIEFIEKNHYIFIENCADDLEIFIEIYFDGGQCNFEIFDKGLIRKIGHLGVSLPVSIYVLTEEELLKWEGEIKLDWERNRLDLSGLPEHRLPVKVPR
jgi:hypothetical protein